MNARFALILALQGASLGALSGARPVQAADVFMLDQRVGTIAFAVDHVGLFSSRGEFPLFQGRLLIDRIHPEQTKIAVEVNAAAVTIPWPDGPDLLRGPDFFDTARHPIMRFTSTAIAGVDPRHFRITGTLEIRGVQQPQTMDATLERQQADPISGTEMADFTVTGVLSRSSFGMTAQPVMISDRVKLHMTTRIELPRAR